MYFQMWPEVTDPTKFVFEDVAIATYLILLWQQEREKNGHTEYQTFADLGCGNGLLVYILTMEGYKGIGIDLKKRNIWDMFPEDVNLKVRLYFYSSNSATDFVKCIANGCQHYLNNQ